MATKKSKRADVRFAGYPSTVMYETPGKMNKQHLIWGDWMRLLGESEGEYIKVHARGEDGWVRESETQENRILEVVFVDIGQGDGLLVVTPDDKHIVIDAGEEDNMCRFLRWRYGGFKTPWKFEAAVISHPDSDHYKGFESIFDESEVSFGTIYHNGIVDRNDTSGFGPTKGKGDDKLLLGLVTNKRELDDLLAKPASWRGKGYPKMLEKALKAKKFDDFQMLSDRNKYLPGYGPDGELVIQVLGPVLINTSNGDPALKWIKDKGKTKNGNSVVLKLEYGNISILLGGDLNVPAEYHLLNHHTGLDMPPKSVEDYNAVVAAARKVFGVDVAKARHHGSADCSNIFLDATNPLVTVISSGDNEKHSHPRADTLGAIGHHSRGVRPLIFCTELARSSKEIVKHPLVLREKLRTLLKEIDEAPLDTPAQIRAKEKKVKQYDKLVEVIERSIAVYGAINLRTDGHKMIIAQKREVPRNPGDKWDIYKLEPKGEVLQYVTKPE